MPRQLFWSINSSVDGFHATKTRGLDWHVVDEDFSQFAQDQLDEAETLVFGRMTYELMADFWPTPAGLSGDPEVARRMNGMDKLVFSRTLGQPSWENCRAITDEPIAAMTKLKEQDGKPMLLLGSAYSAGQFLVANLIDEIRLMIMPVVLGDGMPAFVNQPRTSLRLLRTRQFQSGNMLLTYENPGFYGRPQIRN